MSTKELVWPMGVNRRMSFRQEMGKRERYSSPWAINCRLEDFDGRLRGGSWIPSAAVDHGSAVVHSSGHVTVNPGSSAPQSHPAQCVYRDRLLRPAGRAIFASRAGNYADWSRSADVSDSMRPFVIQLAEAGEIGTDVVSLVPHKDAYLLAATSDSLWVIQGDPADSGTLRNVSRGVGMVGAKAWCRDHLDRFYFLSSHGLYTVAANGEGLQAVSEDVIPSELTGVTDDETVLEYDHETRGVYIHIPDAAVSWLFDTERQGFWPFKVGYSGSHVALGPVLLGDGNTYGRLLRIHGITAKNSIDVTWRVLVADTAEQVAANAKTAIESLVAGNSPSNIHSSGIWTAGVNHRSYPRARGKYMVLLLSGGNGNWGWEGASCEIAPSGAWR